MPHTHNKTTHIHSLMQVHEKTTAAVNSKKAAIAAIEGYWKFHANRIGTFSLDTIVNGCLHLPAVLEFINTEEGNVELEIVRDTNIRKYLSEKIKTYINCRDFSQS